MPASSAWTALSLLTSVVLSPGNPDDERLAESLFADESWHGPGSSVVATVAEVLIRRHSLPKLESELTRKISEHSSRRVRESVSYRVLARLIARVYLERGRRSLVAFPLNCFVADLFLRHWIFGWLRTRPAA